MKVTIKFILYSYIPLISIVVNNGFAATVMECCDKYIHGHKGITSTHTACLLQSVTPVLGCDGDGDCRKFAELCHLPKIWMVESSTPARAADVAAPMRKLWPAYW